MELNYEAGIWYWTGAGVYSLINVIMNYMRIAQSEVLFYNYLIFGVAIICFILNFILLKRKKKISQIRWIKRT